MSIIPQLSWAFYDVCDFVWNQLAAIARHQKIPQAYFITQLRLLYGCRMNTILKKNRSASYGCRKTSVRNHEAVRQLYRRRPVFLTGLLLGQNKPQGRPTTISHVDILGGPVN